jgi:crossover junction endodeoxyribonuclease RuvC
MRFLGIDVGLRGAIAYVDVAPHGSGGLTAHVEDMPIIGVQQGRKKRYVYDLAKVWRLTRGMVPHQEPMFATIEIVNAFPGQGVSSMFSLGQGTGLLEMALVAAEIPYEAVSPVRWKKTFGLIGSGKGKSRLLAQRLFPQINLGARKDEGRAEALLLALYAARRSERGEETWEALHRRMISHDPSHSDGPTSSADSSGT